MSHFSVLVVTGFQPTKKDLEEVLLPYHEYESTGIERYLEFVPMDMEETLREYTQNKEEDQTFEEFIEGWTNDRKNEEGIYGRWTNPNRKWDFWTVGGRWSNMLKNHQGKVGNCCRKGDLNLEAMAEKRRRWREKTWERFQSDIQNGMSPEQVAFLYKVEPGMITREAYIETDPGFWTFAILHEGTWHEEGDMGWWGMVSNEKEDWPQIFQSIFDSIPDDYWLTVIDCHI